MEMASGSGSATKSVLVSVFGRTLSTPEDEQAKVNPVSLHSGKSNTGTDYTKSRLEAVFGPGFYSEPESSPAPENCQLDLSAPKSSSSVDNLLNPCGRICDCEITTGCQITDEVIDESAPVEKLVPSPEDQSNEPLESSSGGFVTTGCQITDEIIDESTSVEKLVSSLKDKCHEALDTTQLIPVMQRVVGGLQRRVRISRFEEGLSPTLGHSPTGPAGQDFSQIEQRFQDLTQKEVVSKEEFDALQSDIMQFLGTIIDEVRCYRNFQMQVHQRVVPRTILCSKGKGFQKILKTLTRGRKSVRLHMLCEQEGEEHKVHDAPGCKLHLKKGESLEAISPFLNHGLRVFDSVTDVAMRVSGVGGNLVSSTHALLQEFNSKIVQRNGTDTTSQTPQAAASKGAEQWLVNHLRGRDMMQDFGLQRMVFEKPNGSQPEGTIVWLCKQHAENGKDSHLLTNLPTMG